MLERISPREKACLGMITHGRQASANSQQSRHERSCRWQGSRRCGLTHNFALSIITLLISLVVLPAVSAIVIPSAQTSGMVAREAAPIADAVTYGEEIIYDRTPPPPQAQIHRRADTNAPDYNETIISDTSQSSDTALPRPFDTTLGNNFTSPQCLPFFQTFLSNATFSACLPFSLLLQTSSSFFQAIRNPTLLTRTLDATCNVNVTDCSLLMSALNAQLRAPNICGPDLSRQNPVVSQAATGFAAYDTLYRAACTKTRDPAAIKAVASPSPSSFSYAPSSDESSDETVQNQPAYCFAAAATNFSAPDSFYTYFLPMGMDLPAGARPACTDCLRDTMAGFAQSAGVKGQGVAGTYAQAAETVNAWCGEGFARQDVALASTSGASTRGTARVAGWRWWWWSIGVVAAGTTLL